MRKCRFGIGKRIISLFMCLLMILTSAPLTVLTFAEDTIAPRYELNFNKNWKFNLGDISGAQSSTYLDTNWTSVNLPHDFSIIQDFANGVSGVAEGESGHLPGGTGWYRKSFVMPSDYAGKSVIINFGGAYDVSTIYVNGTQVAVNNYGYNPFSIDITNRLTFDGKTKNVIAVKVVNTIPSSRYYSGSGLTSDVTMTIVNPVHVSLYGTQVTTPNLKSSNGTNFTTHAVVNVQNDSAAAKSVTVNTSIKNDNGSVIGSSSKTASIAANSASDVAFDITPSSTPTLWSTENPNLYTLHTEITVDGAVVDEYDTTFGYRWFNFDKTTGFSLNGTNMKLQGVCMHRDQGALGAVQEYDAIYRQVSRLKEMGVNSIRTSHDVPSKVYLDVCNELGMLVMEEFFDGWVTNKNSNSASYCGRSFTSATDTNLIGSTGQAMYLFVAQQAVKRDRNDPAVIMWDVGNELDDTGRTDIAQNFRTLITSLDDRPIMWGNNKDGLMSIDDYMDLFGGNYHLNTYVNNHASYNKPFVASETSSPLASRGVYKYSSSTTAQNTGSTYEHNASYASSADYQINAYDASCVGWGNTAADAWYYTIINDWFSGEYIWTGFDYIGEPTPWNQYASQSSYAGNRKYPNSSYFGVIDTAGFAKDSYYLYRSFWKNDGTTTLHLVPGTWNQSNLNVQNGYVDVAVYTNAHKIQLLYDNDVIAEATATSNNSSGGLYKYNTYSTAIKNSSLCKDTTITGQNDHDLYPTFGVKYDSAKTLSVKAFDASDREITDTVGTKSVKANTASQINVSVWNNDTTLTADSDSFRYIEIEARDAEGNFVNDYNGTVNITLNGKGRIAGVDNGNAATTQKYQSSTALLSDTSAQVQLFNGKALVIVNSTEETGNISVTVTPADGKSAKSVSLRSVAETGAKLTDEFEEVIDQTVVTQLTPAEKLTNQKEQINNITAPVSETAYVEYQLGSADVDYVPTGSYVIACDNGVLNYDGTITAGNPTASSPVWFIQRNGDGTYCLIYTGVNTTNEYLHISGGAVSGGNGAQNLAVTLTNGEITIADENGNFVSANGTSTSVASTGTSFKLYKVDGNTVTRWEPAGLVENGQYVIYTLGEDNNNYIMTPEYVENTSQSGLKSAATTLNGKVVEAYAANEITFTKVSGTDNQYYLKTSTGKYINMDITTNSNTNSRVTLSDTPVALTVEHLPKTEAAGSEDSETNHVIISLDGHYLDLFGTGGNANDIDAYSQWINRPNDSTASNRHHGLYKRTEPSSDATIALYNALAQVKDLNPNSYSEESVDALVNSVQAGLDAYNSSVATDEQKSAAAADINAKIAALVETGTKFDSVAELKDAFDNLTPANENYTRYTVESGSRPIKDGTYIIYTQRNKTNIFSAMSHNTQGNGLAPATATLSSDILTTSTDNEFILEYAGTANTYYMSCYVNGAKKYAKIAQDSGDDGKITLVDESDNPPTIKIELTDNNRVLISNNGYYLQHMDTVGNIRFSCWRTSDPSNYHNKHLLFAPDDNLALYNALKAASEITPDDYTDASVRNLLNVAGEGYDVYKDENATVEEKQAAADAINEAIAALKPNVDKIWQEVMDEYNNLDKDLCNTYTNTFIQHVPTNTVPDGYYLIGDQCESANYILNPNSATTSGTSAGFNQVSATYSGNGNPDSKYEVTSSHEYLLKFTKITDGSIDHYYIQNSSGQYLKLSGTNATFVTEETECQVYSANAWPSNSSQYLSVYISEVANGNRSHLDRYESQSVFCAWIHSGSENSRNIIFELYVPKIGTGMQALIDALKAASEINPDNYDDDGIANLVEKFKSGLDVYQNPNATDDEKQTAADAINAAIAALNVKTTKFNATLFKYGYKPTGSDASQKYGRGGAAMNAITYKEMKQRLLTDTNLRSQITALVDTLGAWSDASQRTAAIETVAAQYAKIYALAFTGPGVKGVGDISGISRSYWNFWLKADTSNGGKTGASVQGVFSQRLSDSGVPENHVAYSDALPYINSAGGLTSLATVNVTMGSESKSLTLNPLTDISVQVPDFFTKNDIVSESDSSEYAKYHWDYEIPFIATTNQYGVTTYTFDSSDTNYVIQNTFDDANHKAVGELKKAPDSYSGAYTTSVESGTAKGLFPFNYQGDGNNADFATPENAVYHYGLSFETDFVIPAGGKYAENGNDITFNFTGDDDVLVYIDDVLVLDNAGIHSALNSNINFTKQSVEYTYIANASTGEVVNKGDTPGITYKYGDTNTGISAQNAAALNKLHQVATDGATHTLKFFYLERGAGDANCKISFNLQQISKALSLNDQTYVIDYGLPVEFDVANNNAVTEDAEKSLNYEYVGITHSVPASASRGLTFDDPSGTDGFIPFDSATKSASYEGQYGLFEVDSTGKGRYTLKTMNFDTYGSLYLCAKVSNDPTYDAGTVYYAFEKVTIIPATTVYFEDDFSDAITYTDGSVPTGENNPNNYGVWENLTPTAADEAQKKTDALQHKDIAGAADALVYGSDTAYTDCAAFSNYSAHKVTVSQKNNPNSKFSGGEGSEWPEATFTFAGTGFDVISVTSKNTGAVNVVVKDSNGNQVRNNIVNTYYGYEYGRLYADANGKTTLTADGNTPLYYTADKKSYSTTPAYYNNKNEIVTENTGNLTEAYASDWLPVAAGGEKNDNALYQIPVIKVKDLDYGTYTVTITPMYTSKMDISKSGEYDFFLDAVRIYDPINTDTAESSVVSDAYIQDNEAKPTYLELRDMLLQTGAFDIANPTEGVVFIDGKNANTDVDVYKSHGPNNEVYLKPGQTLAFEIWATAVPRDLQLAFKGVNVKDNSHPGISVEFSDGRNLINVDSINTATDMYHSLNLTANDWTRDGDNYKTGVIVIRNISADADSILSVTNLKWTFRDNGLGISAPVNTESLTLMASENTLKASKMYINAVSADLSVSQDNVSLESNVAVVGDPITVKVTTSTDVATLIIKDENGNVITPSAVESFVETIDNEEVKQWTVTLSETAPGTYTYTVTGAYENGYVSDNGPAVITVQVESAQKVSFMDRIKGFFAKLADFFKKLVDLFKNLV